MYKKKLCYNCNRAYKENLKFNTNLLIDLNISPEKRYIIHYHNDNYTLPI